MEVDVQQTRDGRFVALHDSTVDRTTNGTGPVSALSYDEVRALNAADYEPWKGTEFDPARVASVEEVLALAARVGGGLELDIKGSVTEEGELAELVKRYRRPGAGAGAGVEIERPRREGNLGQRLVVVRREDPATTGGGEPAAQTSRTAVATRPRARSAT